LFLILQHIPVLQPSLTLFTYYTGQALRLYISFRWNSGIQIREKCNSILCFEKPSTFTRFIHRASSALIDFVPLELRIISPKSTKFKVFSISWLILPANG